MPILPYCVVLANLNYKLPLTGIRESVVERASGGASAEQAHVALGAGDRAADADAERRGAGPIGGATLMVAVFNLPGLFLYYILRPKETLTEAYERELAEEALLQDIEEKQACPSCHHAVMPEYQLCPHCHTRLKKECQNCHKLLHLKWNICPYCAYVPNELSVAAPSKPLLPPERLALEQKT